MNWHEHMAKHLKHFINEVPTKPYESFMDYSLAVKYIDWLESGTEPVMGGWDVVSCHTNGRFYVIPKLETVI